MNVHWVITDNRQKVEEPKCPYVSEWRNKMFYIHTMEYYLAKERYKPL